MCLSGWVPLKFNTWYQNNRTTTTKCQLKFWFYGWGWLDSITHPESSFKSRWRELGSSKNVLFYTICKHHGSLRFSIYRLLDCEVKPRHAGPVFDHFLFPVHPTSVQSQHFRFRKENPGFTIWRMKFFFWLRVSHFLIYTHTHTNAIHLYRVSY